MRNCDPEAGLDSRLDPRPVTRHSEDSVSPEPTLSLAHQPWACGSMQLGCLLRA